MRLLSLNCDHISIHEMAIIKNSLTQWAHLTVTHNFTENTQKIIILINTTFLKLRLRGVYSPKDNFFPSDAKHFNFPRFFPKGEKCKNILSRYFVLLIF